MRPTTSTGHRSRLTGTQSTHAQGVTSSSSSSLSSAHRQKQTSKRRAKTAHPHPGSQQNVATHAQLSTSGVKDKSKSNVSATEYGSGTTKDLSNSDGKHRKQKDSTEKLGSLDISAESMTRSRDTFDTLHCSSFAISEIVVTSPPDSPTASSRPPPFFNPLHSPRKPVQSSSFAISEIVDESAASPSQRRRAACPPVPRGAWDGLQHEINNIDDCSARFQGERKEAVPLQARSSLTFNTVMTLMKAKLAEDKARAEAEEAEEAERRAEEEERKALEEEQRRAAKEADRSSRRRRGSSHEHSSTEHNDNASNHGDSTTTHSSDDDDDDDVMKTETIMESEDVVAAVNIISPTRQAAQRAWHLIRRKIKEVSAERKKKNSTFNWSFLRQHINNMTDQEKAREELYDKYIKRTEVWSDGLVNYPAHILDRRKSSQGQLSAHILDKRKSSQGQLSTPAVSQGLVKKRLRVG